MAVTDTALQPLVVELRTILKRFPLFCRSRLEELRSRVIAADQAGTALSEHFQSTRRALPEHFQNTREGLQMHQLCKVLRKPSMAVQDGTLWVFATRDRRDCKVQGSCGHLLDLRAGGSFSIDIFLVW